MARYIDRDKIEYELILAANGHFVVAARKELIDRLPVEDVEPAKSITAADIKKQEVKRRRNGMQDRETDAARAAREYRERMAAERERRETELLVYLSFGLNLAHAILSVAKILHKIIK